MPQLVVSLEDPRQPEVAALVADLDAHLDALYPPEENYLLDVNTLAAGDIRFFVARRDGAALGCGALRLDAGYGEVKRMYVRPEARGAGIGRRVLDRLEAEARALNLPVLRLETGVEQPEAIRLYAAAGFAERGPFGDYPPLERSVFMEKILVEEGVR